MQRATAVLLLLIPTSACGGGDSGLPLDGSAGGARCNVLLVTLDTTRADRLGAYGHGRARTPRIDALAAAGVRFAEALAPAPITLPSHATLMTGVLPPEHGIRDNGTTGLGTELPTLAEAFRSRGWRTGAVIGSFVLDGRYGLARGFDHYEDDVALDGLPEERRADRVSARGLAWLESTGDDPFFLWLHYFDPHASYSPPAAHAGGHPYDGEIAFVDSQLGRVLDALEEDGRLDDTLVIVTSDHGESLGEHGEATHTLFVYRSTLRIPMTMTLPGRIPGGHVVEQQVGLVDVLPTVHELFGWPPPPTATGRSLVPHLRGETLPAVAQYGESEYPRRHYGWSGLQTLRNERWTYVRAPRPELYDLVADPDERNDVADEHPDVVADMEAELAALEAGLSRYATGEVALDAASRSAIESLGYAAGGSDGPVTGADPKDMIEALQLYTEGLELMSNGQLEEATAALEGAARISPGSRSFHHQLGIAYARGERFGKAIVQLRLALDADPGHASVRSDLGGVLLQSGRAVEAIAEFRRVLETTPGHANARKNLVTALLGRRRLAEAVETLRAGLALDPTNAAVQQRLAWLLATCSDEDLRDGEEALRLARAANERAGDRDPRFLRTLAAAQAAAGSPGDAATTAGRAIRLSGADPELANALRGDLASYERGAALRIE